MCEVWWGRVVGVLGWSGGRKKCGMCGVEMWGGEERGWGLGVVGV